jgi:hypothetical protein
MVNTPVILHLASEDFILQVVICINLSTLFAKRHMFSEAVFSSHATGTI